MNEFLMTSLKMRQDSKQNQQQKCIPGLENSCLDELVLNGHIEINYDGNEKITYHKIQKDNLN